MVVGHSTCQVLDIFYPATQTGLNSVKESVNNWHFKAPHVQASFCSYQILWNQMFLPAEMVKQSKTAGHLQKQLYLDSI